jgi:hypothetical protein
MFVGTQWAVARAESTTAVTVVAAQLADLERSVAEHSSALSEAHGVALLAVDEARQKLAAIEVPDLDVDALRESLTRIATLDAEAARLSKQLRSARGTYAEIAGQLDSERSRREKELSEAVATKFFQNLRPTICPRCAAPVTEDRLQAESQGAACSVCVTDLDLSAHEHNLILSALTPEDERLRLERDADAINSAESDQYSDSDLVIDDLEALSEAAQGSQSRVDTLADTLQSIEVERDSITSVLESSAAAQAAAVRRQDAMVELARAEGAAAALAPRASAVGPSAEQIEALRRELRILEAAKATTTKWVQEGQAQRLIELSDTIAALARSFGMVNLTEVKLGGGATMKVVKGGSESTYSKMERGEKLRLKLATAIALIKLGRQSGVGRHPGLLFVDSPGAEEINDDDLDSMLVALNSEATAAEMQVFVATCHTDALVELLGAERCRLGRGNQFVW